MFWRFLIPSHGRTFNVSKLHTARSASAAWDKVSLLQCFAFLFFSAAFPAYGLGYGFNLGKVKRCFGGGSAQAAARPCPTRGQGELLELGLQAASRGARGCSGLKK